MSENVVELLRRFRHDDAHRPREILPADWRAALLEQIVREPRSVGADAAPSRSMAEESGRRTLDARIGYGRRHLAVVVLGVIAAAALSALLSRISLSAQPAQAAVVFRIGKHGEIVARIVNPFAAARQLENAFIAHGLHIRVQVLPAPTSLDQVSPGTTVFVSSKGNAIRMIQTGPCRRGPSSCHSDLLIPRHFIGAGTITIYRPAKPGEQYQIAPQSSFLPGQPLHCSHLLGARVRTAIPVLSAHKLKAVWQVKTGDYGHPASATRPPGDYFVWAIWPWGPRTVEVATESVSPHHDLKVLGAQYFDKGC
jgi:hypothetical protein